MPRLRWVRPVRTWLAAAALAAAAWAGLRLSALADRNVLWDIVNGQCVPAELAGKPPLPCTTVEIGGGVDHGYVLLKDRRGKAQFLLIPTARITGIEDPALLADGVPNYFAEAWAARRYVEQRADRPLARNEVAIAVNSAQGRSQDELHLHISCLSREARDTLLAQGAGVSRTWGPLPVPLAGKDYLAMRLDGAELGERAPFRLLADGIPEARVDMGSYTLALAGAGFPDGTEGFLLLARRSGAGPLEGASSEELQDHDCAPAAP